MMTRTIECPQTCLSKDAHDDRVSNVHLHYSGCLKFEEREAYRDSLPQSLQDQVRREEQRTKRLRAKLEKLPRSHEAAGRLRDFKLCMARYRESKGASARRKESPNPGFRGADDGDVDSHIKAPVMFFRGGQPVTMPELDGEFPNQKVPVQTLLTKDKKANPLMWDCDPDTIRYFHLPANNMAWVEEAIARYNGEERPEKDDLYISSKLRRDRTKTEMILRSECWQSQGRFDDTSQVHARHMRPFCDTVSTGDALSDDNAKSLVLFMPYLHWETDRGRSTSASKIKKISQEKEHLATAVDRAVAARQQDRPTTSASHLRGQYQEGHASRASRPSTLAERRRLIGHVLLTAAALLEAMDFDTEEQLIAKYLHDRSPLHLRRTLDQSYYGALKSTGTRDRDQVVYRATKPTVHNCSEHSEGRFNKCRVCQEDSKKVPRLIMVDQLWLWILDERTVISSFPRRWGKLRPDPSAIHKSLRLRLKLAQRDEIKSAFDLALIIIDQCSRVFFDRPRFGERRPNMVAMFAEAIRGVTYKQTAAFDQFLIYSHLASRGHGRPNAYGRRRWDAAVAHNTLLTINPEGDLLKEVKDIIDEIHIILKIQSQQQGVMKAFVKNITQILRARCRGRVRGEDTTNDYYETLGNSVADSTRRTLDRADELLADVQDRTSELVDLLNSAKTTSAALKDLLTLKQQQAGVIEAREAVKIASETKKQGQYIVTFTGITIIFLPLSFGATLFGMNAAEINDGRITLSDELKYMLPTCLGIIIVSFVVAFSRNAFANAFARLAFRGASLLWATASTWLAIKTGLYMYSYKARMKANSLREREMRITGGMKADYLSSKVEDRAKRTAAVDDDDRAYDYGYGVDLTAPAVKSLHGRNSSALTLGSMGLRGGVGGGGAPREKSHAIDDVESGASTIAEVRLGRSNT